MSEGEQGVADDIGLAAGILNEAAEAPCSVISVDAMEGEVHQALEASWTTMQHVHDVNMNMFISIMRIRFAWIIFFLIVAWLVSNMVLVYASALGSLHLVELYALCGAGFGAVVGWLRCSFVTSRRLHDRLQAASAAEAGRMIRQRIWCYNRGLGHNLAWGAAIGAIAGGALAWKFHDVRHTIDLSDQVLITLISTTTASVIGILAIVMKWLFPNEKKDN